MVLLMCVLLVASYILFFFTADQMNPFVRPPAPLKRRRWRLGRRCAATLLMIGILFLLNVSFQLVMGWWQLPALLLVAVVMIGPALRRFSRTRHWGRPRAEADHHDLLTPRAASSALRSHQEPDNQTDYRK